MILLVQFFAWLWSKRPGQPCRHVHYRERRWLQGTCPMVHFECKDCGYEDRGHVHAESERETDSWTGVTET